MYKRQGPRVVQFGLLKMAAYAAPGRRYHAGADPVPVSYTHLDVYKRQGIYAAFENCIIADSALRRLGRESGKGNPCLSGSEEDGGGYRFVPQMCIRDREKVYTRDLFRRD